MSNGPAIGIDLGMTKSCVAVFHNGKVEIIPNDWGNYTTPSYVAFTDTERLIGDPAKNQATMNPTNTVFSAKRLIGRCFHDPTIVSDIKQLPFAVLDENGRPKFQIEYKGKVREFHAEGISSMVLTKIKEVAEAYLGKMVTDAVITVPTCFNHLQRQATKDACTIAGLNVLRVIDESTTATIAYGVDKKIGKERNVLVFDLGGGFCSVSVLTIEDRIFEVKSISGCTHLGGDDFDRHMMEHFIAEFKQKFKKDLSNNKRSVCRLRTACERAKRTLSSFTEANIEIDCLFEGIDFYTKINRARFEELCEDLFRSTLEPVEKVLCDAKMGKEDIHDVVLVGGSTHIPKIQKLLSDFFNGKKLNKSINPDEAIAYGAAIQAATLSGDKSEEIQDLFVFNVIPLSLGIETVGGVMTTLMKRNSILPKKESYYFYARKHNDKFCLHTSKEETDIEKSIRIPIHIYEGESAMVRDNYLLGSFEVTTTSPTASYLKAVMKVEVSFDIDRNGILSVSAVDKHTGLSSGVTVTNIESRLSEEEIKHMIEEAEVFKAEDKANKAYTSMKEQLETYTFSMKTQLEEIEQRGKVALSKCSDIIDLLDKHYQLTKEELEGQQTELENLCSDIASKVSQIRAVNKGINLNDQAEAPVAVSDSHTSTDPETRVAEYKADQETSELNSRKLATQLAKSENLATDLATRLTQSEEHTRDLTTRLTQSEEHARDLTTRLTQSEEHARDLATRLTQSEEHARDLATRLTQSEEHARDLATRLTQSQEHARDLEARLAQSEERTRNLETRLAQESQPFWIVSRDEIQITEQEIGRGGWGTINVAEFRGQRVAAKTLHDQIISPTNVCLFTREMTMSARIHHPHIVQFIGATREGAPVILLELMSTSLRHQLGVAPLHQDQVLSITCDVSRALNYLHLMQPRPIIHRDVSTANVLLNPSGSPNRWIAKLSDFGSTNFVSNVATAGPGNPVYAAPEAFNPYKQTPKMDVFSFGVVLIEACTREMPSVESRDELITQIRWTSVVSLIHRCINMDQDARPTIRDVLAELSQMQRTPRTI